MGVPVRTNETITGCQRNTSAKRLIAPPTPTFQSGRRGNARQEADHAAAERRECADEADHRTSEHGAEQPIPVLCSRRTIAAIRSPLPHNAQTAGTGNKSKWMENVASAAASPVKRAFGLSF